MAHGVIVKSRGVRRTIDVIKHGPPPVNSMMERFWLEFIYWSVDVFRSTVLHLLVSPHVSSVSTAAAPSWSMSVLQTHAEGGEKKRRRYMGRMRREETTTVRQSFEFFNSRNCSGRWREHMTWGWRWYLRLLLMPFSCHRKRRSHHIKKTRNTHTFVQYVKKGKRKK